MIALIGSAFKTFALTFYVLYKTIRLISEHSVNIGSCCLGNMFMEVVLKGLRGWNFENSISTWVTVLFIRAVFLIFERTSRACQASKTFEIWRANRARRCLALLKLWYSHLFCNACYGIAKWAPSSSPSFLGLCHSEPLSHSVRGALPRTADLQNTGHANEGNEGAWRTVQWKRDYMKPISETN